MGWFRILCLATLAVVFAAHGLHQCDLPDLQVGSAHAVTLSVQTIPCLACTVTHTAAPANAFDVGEILPAIERAAADSKAQAPAALRLLCRAGRAPPLA